MILIVDDDPGTLNALKMGLASFGYQVITAGNAREALKVMEQFKEESKKLDLLLTDLRMPQMSGLELIRKAKGLFPDLCAVIMTAYGSEWVEKEAKKLGVGYLDKPFRPETIVRMIKISSKGKKIKCVFSA